jgi:hypothetical protein
MRSRCGTEKVAAGSPSRRGLEGGSWFGAAGFMGVDPLHGQASDPCRYARPKASVLSPVS